MIEKERLEAEAEQAIENEIIQAQTIQAERQNPVDKWRSAWTNIAYKSTLGSRCVKGVLTLIVFLSLHAAMRYGVSVSGSLLNEVIAKLPQSVQVFPDMLLIAEVLLALIWLGSPALGTFLSGAVLYLAFADMSPFVLLAAFVMLLFFLSEDRPVLALLIALPVLLLRTPLHVGILITLLAAFLSTRNNNGVVRSLGLVYLTFLELSKGYFGVVRDSGGRQIIPAPSVGKVSVRLRVYFRMLGSGNASDHVVGKLLLLAAVFFVIGVVFAKLLDQRYSLNPKAVCKKMQIDKKDGIIFGILLVLLCVAPMAVARFSGLSAFPYGYPATVLQVMGAYVLTRPFAGRSPKRGEALISGDKNYIFVSYAHADLDRIKPYLQILGQRGYEFWYDDSIRTGTEWQGVIASNLKNCTCFLAFISKASVDSEYCLKEINYATSKKKPMAVIMLDDVALPPVLEMHLASLQAVPRGKYTSDNECMQKVFEMEQLEECKY